MTHILRGKLSEISNSYYLAKLIQIIFQQQQNLLLNIFKNIINFTKIKNSFITIKIITCSKFYNKLKL